MNLLHLPKVSDNELKINKKGMCRLNLAKYCQFFKFLRTESIYLSQDLILYINKGLINKIENNKYLSDELHFTRSGIPHNQAFFQLDCL